MLVLPPSNPALHCSRAAAFQRAGPTRVGPVATQLRPVLDIGVVVFQPSTGQAAIDVALGQIGEVLLAEADRGLGTRRHRFRHSHGNAGLIARHNLLAAEVAAIGDRLQSISLQRGLASLATRASCGRSEPTSVTSWVTIR